MHDIVAHSLAVIVRQAEGGAAIAVPGPERAQEVLQVIADTGRSALADMRGTLGLLRDEANTGTLGAPQPGIRDLPELVGRMTNAGLAVKLTENGKPFDVSATVGLAAYRVVQEGLTNAIKYSGPGAYVDVRIDWREECLVVEVVDDDGQRAASVRVPGYGCRAPRPA